MLDKSLIRCLTYLRVKGAQRALYARVRHKRRNDEIDLIIFYGVWPILRPGARFVEGT